MSAQPALITDEQYSAEGIARWLFTNHIAFRVWFHTQYKIVGMYISTGQHDRARFYVDRASEISDHLRAMGAKHLLDEGGYDALRLAPTGEAS